MKLNQFLVVLAAILGGYLILGWALNDHMPESQALFRAGASAEEVLAAEETWVEPDRNNWQLAIGLLLLSPLVVTNLQNRKRDQRASS